MIPNSWRLSRLILYNNFLWYLYGFCLDGKSDQKPMLRTRIWTFFLFFIFYFLKFLFFFSVRSRIWNQIQTLLCLLTRKILPNKYIWKKWSTTCICLFVWTKNCHSNLVKLKLGSNSKLDVGPGSECWIIKGCLYIEVGGGGDDAPGDDQHILQADEGHRVGHQVHVPTPTQALTYQQSPPNKRRRKNKKEEPSLSIRFSIIIQ